MYGPLPAPAAELLAGLSEVERYGDAVVILRSTAVRLDGNLVEMLLRESGNAARSEDAAAPRLRRATYWVEEFRYRTLQVDHLATPEAQAFVRELVAQPSQHALGAFLQQHAPEFDANTVDALYAYVYYSDDLRDEVLDMVEGLGRKAAADMALRFSHRPPRLYRVVVGHLLDAYGRYEMRQLLEQQVLGIDLELGYTLAGMVDVLQAEERLTYDEVHFVEALAKHLTDAEGREPAFYDLPIYLHEYLRELIGPSPHPDAAAQVLLNLATLHLLRKKDPTGALAYAEAAAQLPVETTELRQRALFLVGQSHEAIAESGGDGSSA